ncbi:MAG: hypothetical protein EOO47_06835 [Flavobacterium sp.]|nr:MAG: hypothetical protein EOO47_06835 [Flavobacterium sp.]
MNSHYNLENCTIKVHLDEGIIRVYGNAELWRFLDGKAGERFTLLVKTIKDDYLQKFSRPLQITDRSLIVEILVHVYCDYLGLQFNRLVKFKPLNKFVNKLLERAEVVDCGEKAKDSNRWVWDTLAPLKGFFIKILPRNLSDTNLKLH